MTLKYIFILFISIFIVSSFGPLLAHNRKGSEITIGESIKEILDSVNEIITSGIQVAEKELKKLQKELKKKETLSTKRQRSPYWRNFKKYLWN